MYRWKVIPGNSQSLHGNTKSGTNMAEAYMEENPQSCILAVTRRPQQGNKKYTQDLGQVMHRNESCNVATYHIIKSAQYRIFKPI